MRVPDRAALNTAIERGKASRHRFGRLSYVRFTDDIGAVARGSVLFSDGTLIGGYPPIGRIQVLSTGLPEQFDGPFWVEEKVDGFNVRILRHGDEVLALSRGGYICPFSTDRLPDLLDLAVFETEPDLVLCAEIAGPGNPYIEGHPPNVAGDVSLFVFDLMRPGEPGFLPQREKMALLKRHALPSVEIFGRFTPDDADAIAALILRLDEENREGLVFKPEREGARRAKYVTGSSNIYDISLSSEALTDLPPAYFVNRLMRMALFIDEHGQRGSAEIEGRLGRAFLEGLYRGIDSARDPGRVSHHFRCRFRHKENAERFIHHLELTGGERVRFPKNAPYREGDYWVLAFERIHQRMTGALKHHLLGGSRFD
jgi:putative ATP-dependent DNA ligase